MTNGLLAGLAAATTLAGLAAPHRPATSGSPELTVFAAASLRDAFQELGRMFERRAGVRVRFNFAGSQQLALQLREGARADVFASADERWMGAVVGQGLARGEPRVFAHNRLVVITPAANPARIGRLQDLARRGVKLVVAADAVPVGRYTREMLRRLEAAPGFGEGYAARVLANVVSQEETVRAVAAKVQLGEADAGVVYRSDVTPAVRRGVRILPVPDEHNVIASYPMVALRGARAAAAARAFVDLVLSPEGQRLLRKHGLLPAAAESPAVVGAR